MRDGAPICRVRTSDDLVLDAMPLAEEVLGFSNRWYPLAIETAVPLQIAPDVVIRAVAAPAFLATKWETFRHRGAADPLMSHDLEDIITVVAGRHGVAAEVSIMPREAREFIAASTSALLKDRWAEDIVAGSLPDSRELPQFTDVVLGRLRDLAAAHHGAVELDGCELQRPVSRASAHAGCSRTSGSSCWLAMHSSGATSAASSTGRSERRIA